MGTFIYFTDEQKRRANSVNLAEFLRWRGEKLLPSGRDKRLASDHSITVRDNQWFDHATGEGGLAVDFIAQDQINFLGASQLGTDHPELTALRLVDARYGTNFRYGQLNSPFEYEKIRYVYTEARKLQIAD